MNTLPLVLKRSGLIRIRDDGSIRWPVAGPPNWVWRELRHNLSESKNPATAIWETLTTLKALSGRWRPYIFRNKRGVIKWEKGRLLPRRWGIGWLGFEFGDRG